MAGSRLNRFEEIDTLSIPADLEPGAYTLSLKGVAPSGFTDTDSVAITIH